MLKQYVTFDKDELNRTISGIRSAMYYLDSNIRIMEEYEKGHRIPHGYNADYWIATAKAIAHDMRGEFYNLQQLMNKFGSNTNFDFAKERKEMRDKSRKVLVEKTGG